MSDGGGGLLAGSGGLFAGGGLLAGGGLFAGGLLAGGWLFAGAGAVVTDVDEVVGTGLDVAVEVRTGVVDDVRVGLVDNVTDPDGCSISRDWLLKVAAIPPRPPITQAGRTQSPIAAPPRINRTF